MGERGDPSRSTRSSTGPAGTPCDARRRVHPLSLAVPLAFVLERQAEIRQIRLVLRGAEFGLPADELLARVEL